ncbi:MAG TPA: hypothetical protein VMU16_07300 [Candidatus Binataceae bacterium]|nr:hypothetical protein [Candidatus Binataceae bacterium]
MVSPDTQPEFAASTEPPGPRDAGASMLKFAPGVVVLAIALADTWRFADADTWGHVRFGQDVLAAGKIVWRDSYSYTAFGHLWLNHEWLAEVIMAVLYNRLGVFGLSLMKLACVAITIVFIVKTEAETGAPPLIQIGVLILTIASLNPQFQYRPQLFTFAMLSALLYLLTRDAYRRPARLWITVPMFALWANLHGGFILGIAALWIFALTAGSQDLLGGRGASRSTRLGAVAAIATVATLATPYGIGTWTAVLRALANPYTRIMIQDWRPLGVQLLMCWRRSPLNGLNYDAAIVLMAALALCFTLSRNWADLPLMTIALVMSGAAFAANRNVPAAAIAIAAPLTRHLTLTVSRYWPRSGLMNDLPQLATREATVLLSAIALILSGRCGFYSTSLEAEYPYPVSACEFMRQNRLKGNILTQFHWGEFVIWQLAPDSKVFIDGRYDTVYPPNVIDDFFRFNNGRPGGDAALTKYPTDFVLMDASARVLMDHWGGWRLIYSDLASVLYVRADSPAAKLPNLPIKGVAYVATFP